MEVESDYEDPTDSVQYDDMADDEVRPSGYQPLSKCSHFVNHFSSMFVLIFPEVATVILMEQRLELAFCS